MNRSQAVAYLDAVLGPTRDLAGVAAGDWDVAIDGALLAMGLDPNATPEVVPTNALGYRVVLRWSALTYLYDRLDGLNVNISEPGIGVTWGDALAKLEKQIAAAAEAARPYVVAGELTLDAGAAYGQRIRHQHDVYASTWGW